MKARLALLVVSLFALTATSAAAETTTASCQVDVGAPFLMVDTGQAAPARAAVGGCQLVHDLDEPSELTEAEPGDWSSTAFFQDCAIQLDDDGDGRDFHPVESGDEVPAGADLWAKCETGRDLHNRVALRPV